MTPTGNELDGHRYWSCVVGTTWSVVDADARGTDAARVTRRCFDTVAAGGIVRPATADELTAWTEILEVGARLAKASNREQRLEVLAESSIDIVQLGFELPV